MWQERLPVAFLLVPIGLVMLAMLFGVQTTKSDRQRCLQSGVSLKTESGTVRSAGEDFFVVTDGVWRLISTGCKGKTAHQCYEANPGLRMLRDNVGHPVAVEFCDTHPVAYSVNGARFDDIFPR